MHGKEPGETKKVPLQTKTYKKKMGDKVKEILRKQIKKSKTIRKLEDQYRKQNMQLVGLSKKDNRKRIGKKIPRTNAQKCLEEKVMNLQKQRAHQAASPINGRKSTARHITGIFTIPEMERISRKLLENRGRAKNLCEVSEIHMALDFSTAVREADSSHWKLSSKLLTRSALRPDSLSSTPGPATY